jgi:Fe-S-cluster containining protein
VSDDADETTYDLVRPAALLRRVRDTNRAFEDFARKAIAKRKLGDITCRAGCAHCCKSKIIIDAGQGAVIYLALKAHKRWTPALEAQLLAEDRLMAPVSHSDWHHRRRPCVFLGTDNRCTVHDHRPLGCMATFSVTPDPLACTIGDGKSSFQIMPDDSRQLVAVSEALMSAAGESMVWLMTIPAAVVYGAAMIEQRPRPAVARIPWRRGEEAQELVDRFDTKAAR